MTTQTPTAAQTEAELVDSIVAAAKGLLLIQPLVQAHHRQDVVRVMDATPDYKIVLDWNVLTSSGKLMAIAIGGDGEVTHVLREIGITPPAKRVEH